MKKGKVVITEAWGPDGVHYERGVVQEAKAHMLPIPPGYVPVKFDIDQSVLLVHLSRFISERVVRMEEEDSYPSNERDEDFGRGDWKLG